MSNRQNPIQDIKQAEEAAQELLKKEEHKQQEKLAQLDRTKQDELENLEEKLRSDIQVIESESIEKIKKSKETIDGDTAAQEKKLKSISGVMLSKAAQLVVNKILLAGRN